LKPYSSIEEIHRIARRHLERAYGTGFKKHRVHNAEKIGRHTVIRVKAHLRRDGREHLVEIWLNEHGDLITIVERD